MAGEIDLERDTAVFVEICKPAPKESLWPKIKSKFQAIIVMAGNAARWVVLIALWQAACAPSQVQTDYEATDRLPRPEAILVHDFAVSADEVQLDRGLVGDVANQKPGQQRSAPGVRRIAGGIFWSSKAGWLRSIRATRASAW